MNAPAQSAHRQNGGSTNREPRQRAARIWNGGRGYAAEQSIIFIVNSRGEINRVWIAAVSAVADAQAPKPVNLNRISAQVQFLGWR